MSAKKYALPESDILAQRVLAIEVSAHIYTCRTGGIRTQGIFSCITCLTLTRVREAMLRSCVDIDINCLGYVFFSINELPTFQYTIWIGIDMRRSLPSEIGRLRFCRMQNVRVSAHRLIAHEHNARRRSALFLSIWTMIKIIWIYWLL